MIDGAGGDDDLSDDELDRMINRRILTPIASGRSELQIAQEYRERLLMLLAPVSDLLTEAACAGLIVNFQFTAPDSFKRVNLAVLEITKKLA